MTQQEMDMKVQELWDNAPIKWAFSSTQFKDMLQEWGLTESKEDLVKIVKIANGGFVLRADIPKLYEIKKQAKEIKDEYHKATKKIIEHLISEFDNYECTVTYSPWEGINAVGLEDTEDNEQLIRKAWKKYCKMYKMAYFDPFKYKPTQV